jgi:hypothetical protein
MAKNQTLDLQFYRAALADLVGQLRVEIIAYAVWSCFQVLAGISLVAVATRFDDKVSTTLLSAGGSLLASVTVFPLATVLSTRRKVRILERYRQALQSPSPPNDAVARVREYVEKQLA